MEYEIETTKRITITISEHDFKALQDIAIFFQDKRINEVKMTHDRVAQRIVDIKL